MIDDLEIMRRYIQMSKFAVDGDDQDEQNNSELEIEDDSSQEEITNLISDLDYLVFKLNSQSEPSPDQSYALGFEMGMQRAASALEAIIKKYRETDYDTEI